MEYHRPTSWNDALALKAEDPTALPINGGTDVMVGINFDQIRPAALLDLSHVSEIHGWDIDRGAVRIGAGVTFTNLIDGLGGTLPGLAMASRTVGSPQIRNRGTIGGNLGSASPAGDAHPPLLASRATVELESLRGTRSIPVREFFAGVKRTTLEADELIRAVVVPGARGPQQFSKVGTRNAMVIAVASFSLAFDVENRTVGTGIGSAAPTPVTAAEAEQFLESELAAGDYWDQRSELSPLMVARFSELVSAAAAPITDVRGTAGYRRHALGVMARRALEWAWASYREGGADAR